MSARRSLTVGAIVALGYVAVAVTTSVVSGHSVLPLYEGVGNAPPYQWVNPPAAFKTGNVVPKENTTQIEIGPDGNREGGVASNDTQFIATFSAGAIPALEGVTQASVRIEPLDPATLSELPDGTLADGNAYRMTVSYDPSGPAVTTFSAKVGAVLNVPLQANRGVYFSSDGKSWTRVIPPPPAAEANTVGGTITRSGIYLAGTTHKASAASGSSGTSLVTVIIGVIVGVLLVGGGVWFLLRIMRPAPPAPTSRPPKRRR